MQRSERVAMRTRATAATLAALLTVVLFVGTQPAEASHYTNTAELSATTNPGVAVAWSKAAFPTTASEVLLGRDDLFADSLASGAMQGNRPLLLTANTGLSAETDAELERLSPGTVNILGGTSAVPAAIENDLRTKGYTIRRFSGPTRIETAIDIARRALPTATSAIIAAAFAPPNADPTRAFADSIAAGGWAADRNMPVLLTETERLSISTKNYLRGDGAPIRTVFIVGGSSAVSDAVVTELQQLGIVVRRISGPTRFDTAIRIAQERGFSDASKASEVILAEGQAADAWVAGFAAAAYSASKDAPIVLSNGASLPQPTTTWLSPTAKAASSRLMCAPRVASAACDTASEAMGHTPITGSAPRLLAATVGATAGGVTEVRFTFSEPVATQVSASRFKLYSYDNLPAAATSAMRDTARQDVVVATFAQPDFAESTVAAVAFEAARSLTSNVPNPEGSAGLQAHAPGAGRTRGPNLSSVRSDDTPLNDASWDVDFVFDKPVSACGANSKFKLVDVAQATGATGVRVYSGGGGSAELVGTSTCRASFPNMPTNNGPDWDEDIGRGYVEQEAATSTTGWPSPPGAATVAGATLAPDLISVQRQSATQIRFNFDSDDRIDSAVNVNQAAPKFRVYDSQGRVYVGDSATPDATQGTNITSVIVTFDDGELRNVIMGGSVDEDAVKGMASTDIGGGLGLFNGPDEAAMSPGTFAAGTTAAPTLTAVTRATAGTGATATVTIRFTYSAAVDTGSGGFFVYQDTGERAALTGCTAPTTGGGDDVECTIASNSTALYNAARSAAFAGAGFDAIRPDGQMGMPPDESSPSPEAGRTIG